MCVFTAQLRGQPAPDAPVPRSTALPVSPGPTAAGPEEPTSPDPSDELAAALKRERLLKKSWRREQQEHMKEVLALQDTAKQRKQQLDHAQQLIRTADEFKLAAEEQQQQLTSQLEAQRQRADAAEEQLQIAEVNEQQLRHKLNGAAAAQAAQADSTQNLEKAESEMWLEELDSLQQQLADMAVHAASVQALIERKGQLRLRLLSCITWSKHLEMLDCKAAMLLHAWVYQVRIHSLGSAAATEAKADHLCAVELLAEQLQQMDQVGEVLQEVSAPVVQTAERSMLRSDAEQLYASADCNGDGRLSKSELKKLLKKSAPLKAKLIPDGWAAFFNELDTNGRVLVLMLAVCC